MEASIKRIIYIASAALLISLAAVFSTLYALETYGDLPFKEEQSMEEQWLEETRLQEELELVKELELLTERQLLAELKSLEKEEHSNPQESLIAKEMFTKLKLLFKEQLTDNPPPKRQHDNSLSQMQYDGCEELTTIAIEVQKWRRNNKDKTLDDYLGTEVTDKIHKSLATKVYTTTPIHASPVAIGIDFHRHCLSAYETMNKDKSAL